jgi:HSP20 family protein
VKAEIPGVRKEDIGVEIDGNVVTLRAETKQEKDVKEKGRLIRSERYYGAMSRSFTLGHEVDETKADAKYADGILTLTLPKKVQTPVKKLAIS